MASRVDLGNLAHVNLDILIQRRECHFNLLKPGFVIEPEEPVDLLAVTAKPPRQLRPRDPFPSQRVRQLPKTSGVQFQTARSGAPSPPADPSLGISEAQKPSKRNGARRYTEAVPGTGLMKYRTGDRVLV